MCTLSPHTWLRTNDTLRQRMDRIRFNRNEREGGEGTERGVHRLGSKAYGKEREKGSPFGRSDKQGGLGSRFFGSREMPWRRNKQGGLGHGQSHLASYTTMESFLETIPGRTNSWKIACCVTRWRMCMWTIAQRENAPLDDQR